METRRAETNHGTIAFWDTGGEGPVVLLIHGNSSSKRIFDKQVESAALADFRLIVPDLPGHGESDRAPDPPSTYYIAGYATALIEFMGEIDAPSAHVAGWSLGGHIALEMLARWEGAKSAFIFGTPPLPLDAERALTAFYPSEHMGLTFQEEFSEADARAFIGSMFAPPATPEPWMIEDARACDGRTRAIGFQAAMEGRNLDEEKIVAEVAKPLAVVHGEHDAFIDLGFIDSLTYANRWRGATQVIEGAGHTPQWEAPVAFNALLADFLIEQKAS